ncbi:hypothetical protein QJS10_CPA03g00884 [Acorus calamus]|uniref:Pectinesterase n=1 Tax=Acorus calamus TaxID=4465 RepID=A0AAV9F6V5_ACOCL|nr:hypothetical protein QJS10_CPA03g00884 [Acorus calamus]
MNPAGWLEWNATFALDTRVLRRVHELRTRGGRDGKRRELAWKGKRSYHGFYWKCRNISHEDKIKSKITKKKDKTSNIEE